MGTLRRTFWRLVDAVLPARREASLDREVASHLQLLEDEYRRRGLPPDEARRSARRAFGSVDRAKELHRDARAFRWLDDARRDAAHALRLLRRHPVTTTTAVLSLALGVGLNAAVLSVVDWVLVRPLPYPAPHELVRVFTSGHDPAAGPEATTHALTRGEFTAIAEASALRAAAAYATTTRVLAGAGIDPTHVVVARISGDLFATLGVYPELGRGFSREEIAGGLPVVVLGHALWQRAFAGDPTIAGRTIAVDGDPHMVVGIMPPRRGYPADADVWRPLTADERADDDRELHVVARLRSGTSVADASAQVATIASAASGGSRDAWVEDMQRTDAGAVETALAVLFAGAVLTLVLACVNVAALIGAQSDERAGEVALRGALGATRARVIRQLLCESLVLAAAGGLLGLAIGRGALTALVALAPLAIPRLEDIALDGRILSLGLAATLCTGFAVGVAPGLRLSRATDTAGLRRIGWDRIASASPARRLLVLGQVVIAVVLTACAGLLGRSLQHLVTIDHGFAANQLLSADLYLRGSFDGESRALFRALIEQAEATPGVAGAAVAMRLPTQVIGLRVPVKVVGDARTSSSPATLRPVSHGYFETAGIRLRAGRMFAGTDGADATPVAIVNATFVREMLGGREALRLRLITSAVEAPMTVVGVVTDITPAGEPDRPALYVPVEQVPIGGGYLIVRTTGDARAALPALRERLRKAAPQLAMDRVGRVADALEAHRAVTRFATQVAAAFAGLALLLAIIGVYGLTASDVARRWRELAVRLALGASHRGAFWTATRPCAVVLAAGCALGALAAWLAGPALTSLLHGVSSADAWTLSAAPLLLAATGAVATAIAARRVLHADPATTLRSE